MKRLLNELHQADPAGRLIPRRSSVLIALSGGPDSVGLALLLKAWRTTRSLRLAAAHVNHGLRPSAKGDERWVRRFCRENGLPLYVLSANVRRRARVQSESIEEAARRERYRALFELAGREKFDSLATAHTADDQAETVLMRLASGSGFWGLSAIPALRMQGKVRLIRPLLSISKKDILAALSRARVEYRKDPTNADPSFVRNRVRRRILPELERSLNPRISAHLADLASDAGAWRAWADEQASVFLKRFARRRAKKLTLPLESLRRLPAFVRVPVYFKIAESLTRHEQHLRREHIRQIEDLVGGSQTGERRLALGLRVRRIPGKAAGQIVWSRAGR